MNKKQWFIVGGVILVVVVLLVAIPFIITRTVQQVVDSAVSPFQLSSQQLETQISNVLNPTPTIIPDPVTIVSEIKNMAQLVTVQYTVEKVITAEIGQGAFGFLIGDKLLFVAHGYVRAGIDLEKLDPEDIRIKDGIAYVRLPEPEIFVATLDNEKSYVYDRQVGFLSKGDVNLETSARRVAEQEIEKSAIEDGILDLAKQNSEVYIEGLIRALGFTEVIFED